MSDPRFTLEEFNALFPGKFESREEMLKEYDSFLGLKELFDERYEKGFRKGSADEEHYIALWEGNKTETILAYHVNQKAGVLWMASLRMIDKMEKWTARQARDGMSR